MAEELGFRVSPQQQCLLAAGDRDLSAGCVIALDRDVDLPALEFRLRQIVLRHEALRTWFREIPGLEYPLQVVDESGDWQAVGAGPRLRQLAGSQIALDAPGLQVDAPSLLVLVRELFTEPNESPLQYPDLSEWQWEMLTADSTRPTQARYAARRRNQPQCRSILTAPPVATPGLWWGPDACEVRMGPAAAGQGAQTFLAAWWALLARVTGAAEVATAVVAGGRSLADVASAVGPLAKHVPVSGTCVFGLGLAAVVEQARQELAAAAEWHAYHQPGSGLPTAFECWEPMIAPGVRVEQLAVHAERFDLKLSILNGASPRATLYFNRARVSRSVAEHLGGLYAQLLAAGVADPEQPVGSLLRAAGGFGCDPRGKRRGGVGDGVPIHQRIRDYADTYPGELAVVCGDDHLSYRQLVDRADRLARCLVAAGVEPEQRVGLAVERSTAWAVAMLAVWRAGAAMVPLSARMPTARLQRMRQIADVDRIIDDAWLAAHQGDSPPDVRLPDADARRLAYVLFTSGSTGEPKAVAVEHRQISAYLEGLAENVGGGLRWAWMSSDSTDLGYTAVFGALGLGGALDVVSDEVAANPHALAARLRDRPVDAMKVTPSHFVELLAGGASVVPRGHLVLGGERLSCDLVERIRALEPRCTVWNHYGPTETTIGCTMQRVASARAGAYLPLGQPLAHATVLVLDPTGHPVPPLVVGEICIGGDGVARGYLGQPGEGSGGFEPDPNLTGGRRYRTGDLGWVDLDGTIELIGRADRQIKVRGFRVELDEIEIALAKARGVAAAAVVVQGDGSLAGYVVPIDSEIPTLAELRRQVSEQLPEYMVPNTIGFASTFPRTPSGKIDRVALAARAVETNRRGERPAAGLETELAALWEDVLSTTDLGVDDDFFEIGGHSLAAMRLVGRIHDRFGVEVPLMTIFSARTVRQLARVVAELGSATGSGIAQ